MHGSDADRRCVRCIKGYSIDVLTGTATRLDRTPTAPITPISSDLLKSSSSFTTFVVRLNRCLTSAELYRCLGNRSSVFFLRLLQKSTVSKSCKQDCPDFAERMKCKALRVRSEAHIPPYVTEAEPRKQHSDSP